MRQKRTTRATLVSEKELSLYKEKLALLEQKKDLTEGLPHLHAHRLYMWQREFIDCRNQMCLLTAANQIGKSSMNIIKCITWATSPELWPILWASQWESLKSDKTRLFWYLYPDGGTATVEFEVKWSKYLPSGKYKDHPIYGWKATYKNGNIETLTFNSGVMVVFKFYSQKAMNLQSLTVYACFVDEELPYDLYSEVTSRTNATDGYFNMVFTATLCQEEWRCAMEEKGDKELFKDAYKKQISLFDCMKYEDDTPSTWTERRINRIINSYPTLAEVQTRVYGKFGISEGRVYESFDPSTNMVKPIDIGKDYYIYGGIDIGSGGVNHPAACVLVAVRHDFKIGYIFRGWRGDKIITTNKDIQDKYMEMVKGLNPIASYYDWHAKDFGMISMGVIPGLQPAEKSHDLGEGILNVLFKNSKLFIFDTPELQPLRNELLALKVGTPKNKAKDDYTDGLRYSCSKIPWDYSDIDDSKIVNVTKNPQKSEVDQRREGMLNTEVVKESIEAEMAEWNEQYGE